MSKYLKILLVSMIVASLASITVTIPAQGSNPFAPPTDALDTMSGMSTGPSPGPYMDRARQVQQNPYGNSALGPTGGAQAEAEFFAPRAAQPAQNPYGYNERVGSPYGGAEFGAEGGGPYGGAPPGFAPPTAANPYGSPAPGFGDQGFGGAQAPGLPVVPKVTVLTGERYFDNFTRDMLEEALVDEIPETEVADQFYNDGTHGDSIPNDTIYSNVTENYDYVGQLTHKLRARYANLLLAAEELEPVEFFRLLAVTTDPLSSVNQELEEEEERDERIRAWNMRFLAFARLDPDDSKSEFHPLFVPRAPLAPDAPIPPGYDPRPPPEEDLAGDFGTLGALMEGPYGMEGVGGGGEGRYF